MKKCFSESIWIGFNFDRRMTQEDEVIASSVAIQCRAKHADHIFVIVTFTLYISMQWFLGSISAIILGAK